VLLAHTEATRKFLRPWLQVHVRRTRTLLCLRRAPRVLIYSRSSLSTTSPTSCISHWLDLDYLSPGCTGSTAPTPCIRTCRLAAQLLVSRLVALALAVRLFAARLCRHSTCCLVALALLQPRHAPQLLVSRQHRLYIDYVVCREYSSPGCSGSASTMSRVRVPRLLARFGVDYFTYVVRPGASAPHAARRRLHLTARLLVAWPHRLYCVFTVHQDALSSPLDYSSVGCTGSRRAPGHSVSQLSYSSLGCTSSTAPMSCIRTRHLATRLLVGRSHWLSPCA
jgi:hypothetical protein